MLCFLYYLTIFCKFYTIYLESKINMKRVNIIYDFDGTLTKSPIPRYLILEKCGYENGTINEKFLSEFKEFKALTNCSAEKSFFEVMFKIINEQNEKCKLKDFLCGSKKIAFCKGLIHYFDNINNFADRNDIILNHYVLTSGIKDFVKAC